jgi:hypothetical protein
MKPGKHLVAGRLLGLMSVRGAGGPESFDSK